MYFPKRLELSFRVVFALPYETNKTILVNRFFLGGRGSFNTVSRAGGGEVIYDLLFPSSKVILESQYM
jgi:hypothetical protein